MSNEINIYVANLGKYNEGELVGEWFTLPTSLNEIRTTIGVAHYNEEGEFIPYVEETDGEYSRTYEEWAIHDFESPFKIEEYSSIKHLNEIAELMQSMSELEIEAVGILVDNFIAKDFIEGCEMVDNCMYYHNCDDMSDVAYQYYEQTGMLEELEKHINANYIDWDAIGRDMAIEGTYYELENNTFMQYIG